MLFQTPEIDLEQKTKEELKEIIRKQTKENHKLEIKLNLIYRRCVMKGILIPDILKN